jgi:hypothetical protein
MSRMSFGKLLASGRSLFGGHVPGRYRVNPRVALPKFGLQQNPFSQPDRVSGQPHQEVLVDAGDDSGRESVPSQLHENRATMPASETECANHSTVDGRARHSVRAVPETRKPSRINRAFAKFKAIPGLITKPFQLKPRSSAILRFNQKPVQAELSLDRVQVLRNDLTEADLEIRQATPGQRQQQAPQSDGMFGRMATRIFGAETT